MTYVPYSMDAVNGFYNVIRSAIGTITNAGIVVFSFFVGIMLIAKIIKYFTKG